MRQNSRLYEVKDACPLGELPGSMAPRGAQGHDCGYLALGKARRVSTGTVSHGRAADSGHGPSRSTHPPRGVLPRGAQTWLMAALAFGLLAIIVVTGRPEPAVRPATAPSNQAAAPNPDRLRDYQDRLRVLDERSRQQAQVDAIPPAAPVFYEDTGTAQTDPLEEEKRRREYESLFASNIVVSRRIDGQQPLSAGDRRSSGRPSEGATAPPSPPSLDEVADAVMRASARSAPAVRLPQGRHRRPKTIDPAATAGGPVQVRPSRSRRLAQRTDSWRARSSTPFSRIVWTARRRRPSTASSPTPSTRTAASTL